MKVSSLHDLCDLAEFRTVEIGKLTKEDIRAYCLSGRFLVDDVYREIIERKRIFGDLYPFQVSNQVISTTANVSYKLCLRSIFLNSNFTSGYFEQFVGIILSSYFGHGTRVLHCGTNNVDKPTTFWETISWISKHMGVPEGSRVRPSRLRDGGVDSIVWKAPPDGRSGFPVMLVQSTVQAELRTKCKDIDRRMWSSWLTMDVDPIVALATPRFILDELDFEEMSVNSMILDRLRLSAMQSLEMESDINALCSSMNHSAKLFLNG
jgi:hypothetical protein